MVLAQGASASQAERNWKIYGRILTPQRAAMSRRAEAVAMYLDARRRGVILRTVVSYRIIRRIAVTAHGPYSE